MKFRIQVVRVADDGAERMKEVMEFERQSAGARVPSPPRRCSSSARLAVCRLFSAPAE